MELVGNHVATKQPLTILVGWLSTVVHPQQGTEQRTGMLWMNSGGRIVRSEGGLGQEDG
ncbi:hypothetical protein J6590_042980 [Homalodisca vitripennis]|nr:hypothetical protein J6590_042980 [Homalodisca vitripennis]